MSEWRQLVAYLRSSKLSVLSLSKTEQRPDSSLSSSLVSRPSFELRRDSDVCDMLVAQLSEDGSEGECRRKELESCKGWTLLYNPPSKNEFGSCFCWCGCCCFSFVSIVGGRKEGRKEGKKEKRQRVDKKVWQ